MTAKSCVVAARLAGLCAAALLLNGCALNMPLLSPEGPIGAGDKSTLLTAISLMLIVAIPVFVLTILIAWRYRATNSQSRYTPNWANSRTIEAVVWAVPALIVLALGHLAWGMTHKLSPYRPIAAAATPIKVDAVAMNWKWLFIYPDQHIATVNKLVIPANVPVDFRLTSQTVMTSFFIPRLGSQIYAMPGMQTKLHLLADRQGIFMGRNYQFSGRGYSGMKFRTLVTSGGGFQHWVAEAKESHRVLDATTLQILEKPSLDNTVVAYASVPPDLFDQIINQDRTGRPATSPKPPNHRGTPKIASLN